MPNEEYPNQNAVLGAKEFDTSTMREYAAHLRRVHFVLITISSGLLIASLTNPRYEVQDAQEQLSVIESVYDSLNTPVSAGGMAVNWLNSHAAEVLRSRHRNMDPRVAFEEVNDIHDQPRIVVWMGPNHWSGKNVRLNNYNAELTADLTCSFVANVPERSADGRREWIAPRPNTISLSPLIQDAPGFRPGQRTIAAFASFWNGLIAARTVEVISPASPFHYVVLIWFPDTSSGLATTLYRTAASEGVVNCAGSTTVSVTKIFNIEDVRIINNRDQTEEMKSLALETFKRDLSEYPQLRSIGGYVAHMYGNLLDLKLDGSGLEFQRNPDLGFQQHAESLDFEMRDRPGSLYRSNLFSMYVPVNLERIAVYPERRLRQLIPALDRLNPPSDSFHVAFRDLYEFTKEFPELTFETTRTLLRSELARSGERLELVGIALPTSALRTCGILILIATQFYFLLHLRVFVQMPWSRSSNFPWIGLYTDNWSVSFFEGVLVLPVVCGFALVLAEGWRGLFSLHALLLPLVCALSWITFSTHQKLVRNIALRSHSDEEITTAS